MISEKRANTDYHFHTNSPKQSITIQRMLPMIKVSTSEENCINLYVVPTTYGIDY